jgi:hypothetical protein
VKSRALATIGTGPLRPMLQLCVQTFYPYAERHGYDLVVGEGDSRGRPPAWGKVLLLRRLLDAYDEVLWLDADTMILDDEQDLAAELLPSDYQGLVAHEDALGARFPNTGVWLLRGARARALLDVIWSREEFVHHEWWDNAAFMHVLGFDLDAGRVVRESEWTAGTCWLDGSWNGHTGFVGLAPVRIRHYAGVAHAARLRNMRLDLADLRDIDRARRGLPVAPRPPREPWVQEWITREEREGATALPRAVR